MATFKQPTTTGANPLLFGKRRPATPETALQYAGTDTELDIKTKS